MKSTVFCLHGFTGSAESFAVLQNLLFSKKCICPPIYGHFGCPQALSSWSFASEIERLGKIVQKSVSPQNPEILCGYSLGGRLALGLALAMPQYFRSLVLIASHAGLAEGSEKQDRRKNDEKLACMLEKNGLADFYRFWEDLELFASQKQLAAEILEHQNSVRSKQTSDGLAAALRVLGLGQMPDFLPRLAELKMPVTVVIGELDKKYWNFWKKHINAFTNGRLLSVSGVGHNVLLEQPQKVAEILEEI